MGVEAAVRTHGEWPSSAGVAHSADGLTQEVGGAAGGVGPALAQRCHQHVARTSSDGEEWVIAPLSGVAVMACALLVQPVGLSDGGIQINGQRLIARTGAEGPGLSQRLTAHPIQLTRVAPPETAQERAQRGRRLHRTAQHPLGLANPKHVGVVNAIATCPASTSVSTL